MAGATVPEEVGVVLLPGFSLLALCGIVELLRLANQLLGRRLYRWPMFGGDGGPVRSSSGIWVPTDRPVGSAPMPASLLIVAGFDPWPPAEPKLAAWLRQADRHGVLLGAVDTGSFTLAAAGLLNGTRTALHWEGAAAFAELFPDVPVSDKLFETHPNRLLGVGGVAGLDMMLAALERTHGPGLCSAIAERLVYPLARASRASQRLALGERLNLSDPAVLRVIALMEQHLEQPLSVSALCTKAELSRRTLERKFREQLRTPPNRVYLDLRLDGARRLLRHCTLSVREVSLATGFGSVSYFCRSYKRRFQVTPADDRQLDYRLVS